MGSTPAKRVKVPRGRVLSALLGAATVLVSGGIYLYGEAPDAFVLLYVPVAAVAFYLLSLRAALLQLALIAAGYAGVLLAGESSVHAIVHWALGVAVMGALGAGARHAARRLEQVESRVTDLARTDPLTGLLNRRGFEQLLASECQRVRRGDRVLSLLIAEVDGLEVLNERYGHVDGDRVLERVATVLTEEKRAFDTTARLDGAHFAVLLPDADENGAYGVAERMRAAVSRWFEGSNAPLAIRFGIASTTKHGQTETSLLSAAERALDAARSLARELVVEGAQLPGTIVAVGGQRPSGHGWLGVVLALAETIDLREFGTTGHARAVGRYAGMIAKELGLDDENVRRIELAGVLHDVGKAIVPASVLSSIRPLDDEGWQLVRRHPAVGAEMLDDEGLADLREWVLAHQERLDGEGYPLGIKGGQIPLGAKILAVADAYEAMTTERAYRAAISSDDAQSELVRCTGTQFDKRVVDALVRALNKQAARVRQVQAA